MTELQAILNIEAHRSNSPRFTRFHIRLMPDHLPDHHRRRLIASLGSLPLVVGSLSLAGCGTRDTAPDSTFVLLDGSTTRTADLRGKVTLVNFWATTCVSCVKEMPDLAATYTKYRDQGFDLLAVAMSYDPPAWVQNFATSRQLPFKVALDNTGQIARDWGDVKLTPTTYLVDKQGHIVKRYVGEPDFNALHQLIESLLKA
jgi:peroxiredoxin